MIELKYTRHAQVERRERISYIDRTVGIGSYIVAEIHESLEHGPHIKQLTNTGVIIVRGRNNLIVTMMIATMPQAWRICKMANVWMPYSIMHQIEDNQYYVGYQPHC